MIAQRLEPTFDQRTFLVDNGPTLPAAFAGATMAIIAAHGGVQRRGDTHVVSDEGLKSNRGRPSECARNIGIVILLCVAAAARTSTLARTRRWALCAADPGSRLRRRCRLALASRCAASPTLVARSSWLAGSAGAADRGEFRRKSTCRSGVLARSGTRISDDCLRESRPASNVVHVFQAAFFAGSTGAPMIARPPFPTSGLPTPPNSSGSFAGNSAQPSRATGR